MKPDLSEFLLHTPIVDYQHPDVLAQAQQLAINKNNDVAIAETCFTFVRDSIRHTGDYQDVSTTLSASDVLKHQTGWCYAKSHLLAALLRANHIPTGFCYQRLSCSEYKHDVFCLHGLNAIYLHDYGWYRVDARGNKPGVQAEFTPPQEKLAFVLAENERDLPGIYAEPLDIVVEALSRNKTTAEMVNDFPDMSVD
jgi:transglutaminase-like putative cysteine protease